MDEDVFYEQTSINTIVKCHQEVSAFDEDNNNDCVISIHTPSPLGINGCAVVSEVQLTLTAKTMDEIAVAWLEKRRGIPYG